MKTCDISNSLTLLEKNVHKNEWTNCVYWLQIEDVDSVCVWRRERERDERAWKRLLKINAYLTTHNKYTCWAIVSLFFPSIDFFIFTRANSSWIYLLSTLFICIFELFYVCALERKINFQNILNRWTFFSHHLRPLINDSSLKTCWFNFIVPTQLIELNSFQCEIGICFIYSDVDWHSSQFPYFRPIEGRNVIQNQQFRIYI